jgi:hypothetical protein
MLKSPRINDKLWFRTSHCSGKHFILGNPHTDHGRIYAWCPKKQTGFCVSKLEITSLSKESKYWIEGFLSGNEPEPPDESDISSTQDYFKSRKYKKWEKAIAEFKETGYWK